MSKSALYTANAASSAVAVGGIVPLGTTVRRFGCNAVQNGNNIAINGRGYFLVTASVVAEPTAAGTVGVELYKDGAAVTGATASATVAASGDAVTLPITAIVRNPSECDSALLSFVLTGTAADVTNVAVTVVKL